MGRYALLIGNSNYTAGLDPLPSAIRDVNALRDVLVNSEIGCFAASDVTVLQDARKDEIETAIYHLFANRKNDDLLLFYFSGHGVTDSHGNFYFSSISTDKNALLPTAVSSGYLKNAMAQNGARSKRQVLILDCCHSGAFPKDITKDSGTIHLLPKLGGEGRAILTASDSDQYAFMQEGFELSLYTHFLVEGLKTGAADLDGDGEISVDELYDYVRQKVKNANDNMSPEFHPVKEGYRIILAKAALDDPKLKFRKEVERSVTRNNGDLSIFARNRLQDEAESLRINASEAEVIINDVLRPYNEYFNKLEKYEETLNKAIIERFPFTEMMQSDLQDYEDYLGLRKEDIVKIKERILVPKEAEFKQELEIQCQRQEAEKQRKDAERLKIQGDINRQRLETSRLQHSTFWGLGSTTKIKQTRHQGKANYISENIGNNQSIEFVQIPAGKFMMGMPLRERKIALDSLLKNGVSQANAETYLDWSTPQYEVNIRSFWMGKYTVTNAQWAAVMGTKGSEDYEVQFQGENQPVVGVSWDNCKEFCERISKQIGKNIRLPSEAEWEYACRAGTTTPFHCGETITPDLVNYNGNYPYGDAPKGEYRQTTVDVDRFNPNPWGLYQMHGNVWEWCEDVWHDNYDNAPTDGTAWLEGGEQNKRALRGGSWDNLSSGCRSANRVRNDADSKYRGIGFRVVFS